VPEDRFDRNPRMSPKKFKEKGMRAEGGRRVDFLNMRLALTPYQGKKFDPETTQAIVGVFEDGTVRIQSILEPKDEALRQEMKENFPEYIEEKEKLANAARGWNWARGWSEEGRKKKKGRKKRKRK
jgi:hypothetical protein